MSLKDLPKMDEFIHHERINELFSQYSRDYVLSIIRKRLDKERKKSLAQKPYITDLETLVEAIENDLGYRYSLKPVINATGVVIHTNLGRSVMHKEVLDHVSDVCTSYNNLEFDLISGKRGSRYDHLVEILCELTGAEDAHIVNNNAAAVLLVLHEFCNEKEAIVSRGELVEIGGSFRIPDVMTISGASLKEVGTTNRTHLDDYEKAINNKTGLLMKVHKSNYYIEGFTSEVNIEDLSKLSKDKEVILYEDLGSGYLHSLSFSTQSMPLRDNLKYVDLLSISGDKLLGGSQAGIILGKKELIRRLKKNQLTRALRVDKMILSALEATLKLYLEKQGKHIPTTTMLALNYDELYKRSEELSSALHYETEIIRGTSLIGGGSLPEERIESPKIRIALKRPDILSKVLRDLDKPIIATVSDGALLLDLRCVLKDDFNYLIHSLNQVKAAL